jgi:hypothetical protein
VSLLPNCTYCLLIPTNLLPKIDLLNY